MPLVLYSSQWIAASDCGDLSRKCTIYFGTVRDFCLLQRLRHRLLKTVDFCRIWRKHEWVDFQGFQYHGVWYFLEEITAILKPKTDSTDFTKNHILCLGSSVRLAILRKTIANLRKEEYKTSKINFPRDKYHKNGTKKMGHSSNKIHHSIEKFWPITSYQYHWQFRKFKLI